MWNYSTNPLLVQKADWYSPSGSICEDIDSYSTVAFLHLSLLRKHNRLGESKFLSLV